MEAAESVEDLEDMLAGIGDVQGSYTDRVIAAAVVLIASQVKDLRSDVGDLRRRMGLSDEAMLHISQVQRTNELLEDVLDALSGLDETDANMSD